MSFSQCLKVGEFQNSTDIKTSGEVTIVEDRKGRTVIKIANNFSTQEGPDLDVYLSKKQTVDEGESIRVEPLFVIEGSQRYVLNEDIKISDYKFIVIHCTKWNHWYGSAELKACEQD